MRTRNIVTRLFIVAAALLITAPALLLFNDVDGINRDIDKKFIPGDWFHLQRAYPYSEIPHALYIKAFEQKDKMLLSKQLAPGDWIFAGPDNIGGRITALEADYTNPSIIFIGSAAGGVFKSTDAGETWTPQTDKYPSLSVGALAMDPVDPKVLYCGTGEANISIDSYAGIGILKTTNGGDTWEKSGLDSTRHIADIEVHPLNRNTVFVAASGGLYSKGPHRGIYRSTNAGKDWIKVLHINDSTSAVDVAIDPLDTSRVYAAVWERLRGPSFRKAAGINSGIFVSNDGGWNWSRMANGLPAQNAATGRISIAVAPSNPNFVYALYQNAGTANGTIGQFDAFYRTTNKGLSWAVVNSSSTIPDFSNFGWYFGLLKVAPDNHLKVYSGGIDLFVTTDGGNGWTNITNSYSGTWDMQHPDQHALWFDRNNPAKMYNGNDGGFFFTTNAGVSWTKKYNLPISQFYAACVDNLQQQNLYGGLQDNGSVGTQTGSPSDWREFVGGDGFVSQVDYTNSNIIYMEWQNGGLNRSTDKGLNYSYITSGLDLSRTNWCSPYILDPVTPSTLYFGSYKLFKSTDQGSNWNAISADLTRGQNGRLGTITAVSASVAPGGARTFYVATDDAKLSVSTNSGTTWIDRTGALPRRYMTDVVADKNTPTTAYVTLSGYNLDQALPHVFRTTDAGATWTPISSNLPMLPVNSLIIDYTRDSTLYIGTDAGVFYTVNLGRSWQILGNGLPNSPVSDLVFHQQSRTLYAATHGRSIYAYETQNLITSNGYTGTIKPGNFEMYTNYPNPFNAQTRVSFSIPGDGEVEIAVYNSQGRQVAPKVSQKFSAGKNHYFFNAIGLPSGIYFCRTAFKNEHRTIKMILLK